MYSAKGAAPQRVSMYSGRLSHRVPGGQMGIAIGVELVERVEACKLDAGDLVQALGGDLCVELLLRGDGALVAIAEGRCEWMVFGVEADVVDGPAIDGDGADAFGRELGGAAKAFVDAGFDGGQRPAEAVVFDGAVGKSVDERDFRRVARASEAGRRGSSRRRDRPRRLRSFVFRNSRCSRSCLDSPEISLHQTAVDRDEMTGGAARQRPCEEQDGLGAVLGIDGLMRERARGVEVRQHVAEIVVRAGIVEGEVVLLQRGDDAIAREHRGALDDRGGADAVDADLRRQADGELADEMAERGLADVVGLAAALGDDGVGGAGEDDAGLEALRCRGCP